jgi:hypothetical protein
MIAGPTSARLVVAGLFATFMATASAQAAKVAVQVPIVESDTKISEGRRNKFHDTLVSGLKEAASTDTTIITGEEVRFALGDKPSLLDCHEGACLQKVAELLKADRLIIARINIKSSVGGSAYKIALSVYDANGNAVPVTGSESCGDEIEGCNLARAFDALKRSTASIASQLMSPSPAKQEPQPTVAPPPVIPPAEAVPAVPKDVKGPEQVDVKPSPYAKFYRYGFITAAALTGAFVIASIPFLSYAAKEGQITCGPTTPRDQCPTV